MYSGPPLNEEAVTLKSGARARISRGSQECKVGVIALHPWGPIGGSMHDPHVVAVTRYFGNHGCATCRVAFRTGFSCGTAPILDVVSAADKLLEFVDSILIVGYSYGSIVAMAAPAEIPQCIAWVAINPPLDVTWALFLFNGSKLLEEARTSKLPKLLIHATVDQFCSNPSFDAFISHLPEPKFPLNIPRANHFDVVQHLPGALSQFLRSAFYVSDTTAFARGDFSAFPEEEAAAPQEAAKRHHR